MVRITKRRVEVYLISLLKHRSVLAHRTAKDTIHTHTH